MFNVLFLIVMLGIKFCKIISPLSLPSMADFFTEHCHSL